MTMLLYPWIKNMNRLSPLLQLLILNSGLSLSPKSLYMNHSNDNPIATVVIMEKDILCLVLMLCYTLWEKVNSAKWSLLFTLRLVKRWGSGTMDMKPPIYDHTFTIFWCSSLFISFQYLGCREADSKTKHWQFVTFKQGAEGDLCFEGK